ncbi:hypothetical protein HD806DRAFT_520245 [Xylariaceae sp. AK1471]|nr:hypothetical protein HD806DRAFT_520245 [Xylariaceae sp. AK1471]
MLPTWKTHDPAKLGENPQQGAASVHRATPTAAAQVNAYPQSMDEGTRLTRFTFIGSHHTGHFIYCSTFHGIPNLDNPVDMQAMWPNHLSNMVPGFGMGNYVGGQLDSGGARHPGASGGVEFGHHSDVGGAGRLSFRELAFGFQPHSLRQADSFLDINFPFLVSGTLVATSLYLSPENSSSYDAAPLHFGSFIENHANLTCNSNVDLSLDEVETLGGSLVASNNTNCTFSFSKLSEITGNISMTDNPDSTLPWFPDLRRAANIQLRGNIDTSQGPNIFPALTTVPGTVTIEAQVQAGIIRHLVCNGTDGTQNDKGGRSSSLSGGAWTGIGIAIAIMVLQNAITVW